jgi:hypothetical protein
MALRDKLRQVTTTIEAYTSKSLWTGTGFFYKREVKDDDGKIIDFKLWLVTNRHVVLEKENSGKENLPTELKFNMRCVDSKTKSKIQWFPIVLNNKELTSVLRVHKNADFDVAVVEVTHHIIDAIKSNPQFTFTYTAVSEDDIPQNNGFDIDICDDAIAIGYPRGYYDVVNLFPIIKSGIIASPWNVSFEGKPMFLLDVKLFPGSSGSLVISKPSNDISINGKLQSHPDKHFAFLGVFSGEPYKPGMPIKVDEELTIIKNSTYNLGVVWYSFLIDEIIDNGVTI